MSVIVGIDLGTTYSAVAALDASGNPYIVPNKDGEHTTASCVVEREPGVMEVGEFARRQWGNAPESAAGRFKRDMGTSKKLLINGREFTPTQLSGFVLKKLVTDTERQLGKIDAAVVTIPANFANEAREATMEAARIAGLKVQHIVNEPTAAALCYAFKSGKDLKGNYAVYDLGGGTFDITLIKAHGKEVSTLASDGVARLGGSDFDDALQRLVHDRFREQTGRALEADDFTRNDAEADKKALSVRKQVTIRVARQMIDIKRADFEEAISVLVSQAEMVCESVMREAKLEPGDIDGVFLVGGSTRIPLIVESVERVFGRKPVATQDVDEVVALGAVLYAAHMNPGQLNKVQRSAISEVTVSERTGKCFGTLVYNQQSRQADHLVNVVMIPKGEPLPATAKKMFSTVYDDQRAVQCRVTESATPETDPRFVKVIWAGELALPAGRPKDQNVEVTYSYDENQIMKCSFLDVTSGRRTDIDLSMASAGAADASVIQKFMVE